MTLSTLICGPDSGLVIAPISTTTINVVRDQQMGMAASVITVLCMVGMILWLAVLTSWGLGHFYALTRSFKISVNIATAGPSALAAYEAHVAVSAAHGAYTSIFLVADVLCLVAVLPACRLEGRKPSLYSVRRDLTDYF